MSKVGVFYGIGVGPGDPSMLTLKAVEVLKSVDIIFEAVGKNSTKSISATIISNIDGIKAPKEELMFSMSRSHIEREKMWNINAEKVSKVLKRGLNVAFVTIGDPLIYSTYTYLLKRVVSIIPNLDVVTIPGITSFQYSASKLNMPIVEDEESLLLIPAWRDDSVSVDLAKEVDTVVCLKSYRSRNSVINSLISSGNKHILYAERVGMDDEFISSDISDVLNREVTYLSHLIGKKDGE